VKLLEDIGLPRLTPEQIEDLCRVAEEGARRYVSSRVSPHRISELNVTVDVSGMKPVTVSIDVEVVLSPLMRGYDVKSLVDGAVNEAFQSVERYLRRLACGSGR